MYFSQVRIRTKIQQSSELHRLIQGNAYGIHQLLWNLFPNRNIRSFLYREEIAREQLGVQSGVKGEPIFYLVSEERPAVDDPLLKVETKVYSPKLRPGDTLAFKLRANPVIARKCAGRKNSVRHDVVMDSQRNLLLELSSMLGLHGTGTKSELKKNIVDAVNSSGNRQVRDKLQAVINENERFRYAREPEINRQLAMALKAYMDKNLEKWLLNKAEANGFELIRDEKGDRLKFQAESYRWHHLPKKGKTAGFSSVDFDGVLRVKDPGKVIAVLFKGIGPAKAFGCGLMLVRRV